MMKNYRTELSEDGISVENETKILFGQCGPDKRIHLTEVMEYCADFVTDLYALRGQNRDFLAEHGYAQMVSRASFHINRLPKENDEVLITVREEKPEGVQFMRYYQFKDLASGEVLIEGKSLWVVVNPETRAIVIPAKFEFLAKSDLKTESVCKPGRIKIPEDAQKIGEQKILYSMIDGNGHLTNAKYINFALDFLPEEYQARQISDFKLNFCKEIRKSDTMIVNAAFDAAENRVFVEGKIASSGERSFECEILYR